MLLYKPQSWLSQLQSRLTELTNTILNASEMSCDDFTFTIATLVGMEVPKVSKVQMMGWWIMQLPY
jgi:hypothetical protein